MLKSKTMGSIIGAVMIVVTMAMPVLAAEPTQKIDYTEHSSAELDPDYVSARGIFDDYVVYSDAWWIISNGVGVGAKGWTDIDEKSDGSDRYHYSNIRVYSGSQYWKSGREWGYGRVEVSTGNVGQSALSDYRLFYGF